MLLKKSDYKSFLFFNSHNVKKKIILRKNKNPTKLSRPYTPRCIFFEERACPLLPLFFLCLATLISSTADCPRQHRSIHSSLPWRWPSSLFQSPKPLHPQKVSYSSNPQIIYLIYTTIYVCVSGF